MCSSVLRAEDFSEENYRTDGMKRLLKGRSERDELTGM